jgi:hypothetical protein
MFAEGKQAIAEQNKATEKIEATIKDKVGMIL